MKKLVGLLLIFFTLISCGLSEKDKILSFNEAIINQGMSGYGSNKSETGWFVINGVSTVDSIIIYKRGMHSLFSIPKENDTSKTCQTFYSFDSQKIEGDSILFKGVFRISANDTINIFFGIQQILSNGYPIIHKTEEITVNGDSEWAEFELSAKMDEKASKIQFLFYSKGDGEIWTSNWQATIDGKSLNEFIEPKKIPDTEFDGVSNVILNSLTPQMIDNLEVLGKVWGFLKYYHPEVVKGKYNWDYELFRILPEVAEAKDKEERSRLLNRWIDGFGTIKEKDKFIITDSSQFSRIINLDWLNDESTFNQLLIDKLNQVKDAKRSKKYNHYMLGPQFGHPDRNNAEKNYPNISWEDQGYRLLTLFRLWNAVEYCSPYVELTDNPWQSLLREYIPQFVEVQNKTEYELSIIRLFSNIDESHGWISIPKNSLSNSRLVEHHWARRAPFKLVRSKEGKVVVCETQVYELQRGDIIVKVGGKKIDEAVREREPYIATSNESTLYRDILPYILYFYPSLTKYVIERDGNQIEIELDQKLTTKGKIGMRSSESYNLAKLGIGYIDVSNANQNLIKKRLAENPKGVILDMRNYPQIDVMRTLLPILTDKAYPYVWFSSNERERVGTFIFIAENETIENPNYYKGKVAILVNEGTQSHGEFSAMAYRKATQSAIIGSQTAGADGDIQTFYLPGDISVTFTGLGTYYPNWEMCQRVGLKIDIPVRPTAKGLKEGRDELIEEAINYILK